jgi:hypothetical protein
MPKGDITDSLSFCFTRSHAPRGNAYSSVIFRVFVLSCFRDKTVFDLIP